MSRIFEALQQAKSEVSPELGTSSQSPLSSEPIADSNGALGLDQVSSCPIKTLPEYRLVVMTDEHSLGAEKIRVLSTRLNNIQQRRRLKKILITSSISEEGKSLVSANLALTLAMRSRKKTLLIDGDLRRPTVSKLFGTSQVPGLTEWWQGGGAVCPYLRRVENLPLWLLPAGRSVEQPLEVLQSEHFSQLVTQVGDWFDWVIVDSPPLSPMADASVWVNLVDGVLVVARAGRTPKKLIRKVVVDPIEKEKLIGIVLNEVAEPGQKHYYSYYEKNRRSARPQEAEVRSKVASP